MDNMVNSINPFLYRPIESIGGNQAHQASAGKGMYAQRGSAWDGFNTPANNGTGELIANIDNREDAIEGCTWSPYFA